MAEDNLPVAGDAEIAQLEGEMADTHAWFHNEAGQARYRALIEAKEAGRSMPAAPNPRAARRGEIEAMMADTKGPYWKSSELQAEYRQLISDGPPAASDDVVAARDRVVDDWRSSPAQFADANPALAAEWNNDGDLDSRLSRAQDVAKVAVDGIADPEQRADLISSFDELSGGVQAAILGELSMPQPGYVKEASAAEIELFRETPEGDDLVREWGGANSRRAARHVGAVRAKMRAAVDAMSPADREEFGIWYDGLSEAEARAALAALVA